MCVIPLLRPLPSGCPAVAQRLPSGCPAVADVLCRWRGALGESANTMERIAEMAGVVPWVNPLVNLRSIQRAASRKMFPDHVVNKWI